MKDLLHPVGLVVATFDLLVKQYRSHYGPRPLWPAFCSEAPEIEPPIDRGDPAQRRRFRDVAHHLRRQSARALRPERVSA